MKRNIIFITAVSALLVGATTAAGAQETTSVKVVSSKSAPSMRGVIAENAKVTRDGSNVVVDMKLDLSELM